MVVSIRGWPGPETNTQEGEDSERSAARTAATKAWILSALLMPLDTSTPELTSTAQGRTRRMPSVTFAGVSPPDKTRRELAFSRGCDQGKAVQSKD